MFVSSIGALNAVNHKQWVHQPRKWPGKDKSSEDTVKYDSLGPGVRRAAEPMNGNIKDIDPLAELRKEILGE